ncbi:restriction endonuclease [Xanthomonas sacchari]
MNDYDFRQLSDKEFESFCCDLLSREFSNRFERFRPGRDAGVDGRFFSDKGEVILQCKHWLNTPLSQLINALSRDEAPKVVRLAPVRYVLAVSHALSRTDKKKICEVFSPFIRSADDVLGREDLNDILAKHTEVERRHYKLWIASSTVLTSILHAPIYGRSDFLIKDIVDESVRYAITKNHELAVQKIEEKRIIILTGEAGIGKTTLARNILLPYLADGYELFSVGESISEAEGVFQRDKKQIFYFDDFLGSNYLDAIAGNSGAQVVNFMKRVKSDPLKRFVLTSRTTILNQGKILIGALSNQNTSKDEFEISLQSLSRLDKARILYNHMWHSDLPDEYKNKIYENRRYKDIVDHKNYNPRIISYITDGQRLEKISAEEYWGYILKMLDNPAEVWSHPFDAQHDDYGRALVLLVALNGRPIPQEDLAEAYYRYIAVPQFSPVRGHNDFLLNLRHLCGSMLNRIVYGTTQSLTLFNPSIRDFIIARYSQNRTILKIALCSLRSEDSIAAVRGMLASSHVDQEFVRGLLSEVAREANRVGYIGYQPGYIARVYLFLDDLFSDEELRGQFAIDEAIAFVEREDLPKSFEEVLDFFIMAGKLSLDVPRSIERLIEQARDNNPSAIELERLAELIAIRPCGEHALEIFRSQVCDFFSNQVHDEFPAEDVFDGLGWGEEFWEARQQLDSLISSRLDVFGFSNDADLVDEIASNYDFHDQARGYFMGRDEQSGVNGSRMVNTSDDVDDLFDRS